MVSITIDPAKLAAIERELRDFPSATRKATAMAINDAATRGVTQLVRAAAAGTTAKQKNLRKRIKVDQRAKPQSLSARILVRKIRLALMQFRWRRLKRSGVRVEILRGQTMQLPDAFPGIGPEGKQHLLKRVAGKRRLTRAHHPPNLGKLRQEVATLLGVSIGEIFDEKPQLLRDALEQIYLLLEQRLDHQLGRVLKREARP